MCRQTGESMMGKPDQKVGRIFLVFVGICIIATPFIVLSAFSYQPEETVEAIVKTENRNFDQNGNAIFISDTQIAKEYLQGVSTGRTLDQYYSRRQYLGSPPYIPHTIEEAGQEIIQCIACHSKGGWTEELRSHTPITPHPEQTLCRQCHVRMTTEALFVGINWMSLPPPRLGRAHLPGAPPPIPHGLQMRGDCNACHVGPGAVSTIRVEHPSRGNCRQCHVPDSFAGVFERKFK